MHRVGWRCRFRRALLLQIYYATLLLGVLCLPFDFERRQLVAPGHWRIYAFIINLLTMAAAPAALPYAMRTFTFYAGNQLMRSMSAAALCVRTAAVILTLLFRRRRERCVRAIVLQLLALEVDYFDAVPVQRRLQQRFDLLLYAKYGTVALHLLAVMYTLQSFGDELSLWWVLLVIYLSFTLYLLHSVTLHYCLMLGHIWKRFCVLNAQLEEIFGIAQLLPCCGRTNAVRKIARHLQHALADEVDHVARVHRRLTEVTRQLNDCFQYQTLLLLLTRLFDNITLGYIGLRLYSSGVQQQRVSSVQYMFGAFRYLLSMVDLFLVDMVCDGTCGEHQRAAETLKRFHELTVLDADFKRSCDLLTLQLKEYKLTVNICGLFELNRRNSLTMLSGILQRTIWLLQYDFEEHSH